MAFARQARGQHSHTVAAVSALTVLVLLLIAVYDLRSTADKMHARIPYLYLAYLAAGMAWYALRHRRGAVKAE
ncbi:MAG: hypothetical protein WBD67_13275 [Terracidiphilus sp.]